MMSHIREEETKAQKVHHSNSRSKIQPGSADLRPQVLSIIPTVLKPYCAAGCGTPPPSFWFCRSRVGLEKSAFLTVPRWCCWCADHTWRTTELHQTFFGGRELPCRMKQLCLWQKGGGGREEMGKEMDNLSVINCTSPFFKHIRKQAQWS